MARRRHELDTRILTIFFVAAAPFVAFGAWLVVTMAQGRLEESLGESLEQRALQAKLSIERYVGEQIVTLHLLAVDPEVMRALSAKELPRGDHPLSGRLREIVQVRPSLRMLQVVDAAGRVVAASARSARIIPLGAPWKEVLLGDEPTLRPFVGDIQRVSGSDTAVLEIAYPVRGLEGPPRGLVRGLVDAADLYGVLASIRIGRTGHAVLLRAEDGMVLASDEQASVLRDRFRGFATIQAAMREKKGYWRVPAIPSRKEGERTIPAEPDRLVGYAPIEQVPDVNWLVTVEQDLAEATAPLTGVTRYLWPHFGLVFVAVILLALYFSFKLEEPVIEEELHLHEEHVPESMRSPSSSA
jgi:hypothetical protein